MPTSIDNPWLIVGGIAIWFAAYFVYKLLRKNKK